jgi:hypothetical protein
MKRPHGTSSMHTRVERLKLESRVKTVTAAAAAAGRSCAGYEVSEEVSYHQANSGAYVRCLTMFGVKIKKPWVPGFCCLKWLQK